MFNTTVQRRAGPDPLPSGTRRDKTMLTALTKVKVPAATAAEESIVAATEAARCGTRKEALRYLQATTPMHSARSGKSEASRGGGGNRRRAAVPAMSTSRSSLGGSQSARSGASTARSDASHLSSLNREKSRLEDQLWDVTHKADWLKAQTGLRTTMLRKDASPDRWLGNGAKMFLANRYRSTSHSDYVGYYGHEVFSEQVTDTSNRRFRGDAARYGNRLSGAKITLRGAF